MLVKSGRATFQDLKAGVQNDEDLVKALSNLKSFHLIAEKQAPLRDFTTYYSTVEGFRIYNNLGISSSSVKEKISNLISSVNRQAP